MDDVEVVFVVADDREEQEPFCPTGEIVIRDFVGRVVGPSGQCGDTVLFFRLVVRRIVHREHPVPPRYDMLAELRQPVQQLLGRRFRKDLRPQRRVLHPPDPLLDRQLQQSLVTRPDRERVQCRIDPQHHAHRPAGHLSGNHCALRPSSVDPVHQAAPADFVGRPVGQQEPHRTPGVLAELRHPFQLFRLVLEVAVDPERAITEPLERRPDPQQFINFRVPTRHHLAGRRLVGVGPRRRETERPRLQPGPHRIAHRRDIVRRRLLPVDRPLTHHIDAQRMMRNLRRDIDRPRHLVQRIQVLRERLPVPLQPVRQRYAGNFLDRFHHPDQRRVILVAHRCEPDAAVAEQDRRDTVP